PGIRKDKPVGATNAKGYLHIRLVRNGKWHTYPSHRYIYEVFHGVTLDSTQQINHINHVVTDNRIDNLEVVSCQQNQQWKNKSTRNTSGYKGVSKKHERKKYESSI